MTWDVHIDRSEMLITRGNPWYAVGNHPDKSVESPGSSRQRSSRSSGDLTPVDVGRVFELFNKKPAAEEMAFDEALMQERIAEALTECGLDPDGKAFFALQKMLCDDVAWYFDSVRALSVTPTP